jgi:Tol biopolymer transport system component
MLRAVRNLVVPIGFALLVPAVQAGQIELLSRAATESDTALGAEFPRYIPPEVSADGRWVAFSSTAVNLVPGQDPDAHMNLFLHDRQTGTTALVTHASGSPTVSAGGGNVLTEEYSISDDGRWIVYESTARDLVENQVSDPWIAQVFLYDRETGVNTLLSHSIQGSSISSNGLAGPPRISGDGNWIVYESAATDLLAGQSDTPGTRDVFLQKRANGLRILVSRAAGTSLTAANHGGQQTQPSVSDDGRWVAFQSVATNLIPGFSPPYPNQNVYLFDRLTGAMTLVSHTSASATNGAGGRQPRISPDGAAVLFGSLAGNIVPGQIDDPSSSFDLFLFDRASGANALVSHTESSSVTSSGGVLQDDTDADVAAGGAWVVFGQFYGTVGGQIYLYRRSDATVTLVSRSIASPAQPANSSSSNPRITPDGAFVVFGSAATDLVPGQSSFSYNVFVLDRAAGTLAMASGADGSGQAGGNNVSFYAAVSDDGSAVPYYTHASNLDAGTADLNNIPDLAIYDRASAASTYATLHAPGQISATASGDSALASASADGRYAVFLSEAPNVIPGQVGGSSQVFLVDRTMGTTTLVSRAAGQTVVTGDGWSSDAAISADGNYVVFTSIARNLVPGQIDTNTEDFGGFEIPGRDVFLYDRAAGTTTLVSHAAGSGVTAGSHASLGGASLSADGRYVTFISFADDLVPSQNDTGENPDVFLYDRVAGTTTLVSRKAGTAATAGNRYSVSARISGDGRWIAFHGEATDLVAGMIDPSLYADVFLFDRVSGQTLLVSRAAGTAATAANRVSWVGALNPDGRYLVFSSSSGNLVPGQNGPPQSDNVFLFDRVTGTVELISRAAGTATTTVSGAQDGQISDDGRYVVFRSAAGNLVPGQTAGPGTAKLNVFVHDRVTRQTEIISRSVLSPLQTSNHDAQPPTLSPDGRYVGFFSQATDLAAGATGSDLYLADRQLHTLERVAAGTGVPSSPYVASVARPRLSPDGGVVLFTSAWSHLAADDLNVADDVFAWTRSAPGAGDYYTVAPCRLIDTRQAGQGPALASGVPVLVDVHGVCGIPGTAKAVAVNVTVLQAQGAGSLTLHPGNLSTPNTSTINFPAGLNLANNAILALASNGEGTLGVTPVVSGGGTVHVVVDVSGYFQ